MIWNAEANRAGRMARTLLGGIALSALFVGTTASASAQDGAQADADQAVETTDRLPDVVITATKRAQTLQDTPVAVSVVTDEDIDQAEIQDLLDLQTLVPSLAIRQGQTSGAANFYIRGFGNGQNAIGLEPSVGVFVDGVYRSRSAASISDLPNVERVEVLRGPQSTLFGKNASAGVISVSTHRPAFESAGHVEASIGNYDLRRFEAFLTGPLTRNLAMSLSGNVNMRDGYVDDLGSGATYNDRRRWGIRGDILWEPSSKVSVRLIADYDRIDEDCCILTNLVEGPTGATVRALGGQFVSENPFSYDVYYDVPPRNDIRNRGVSLQGDFDLGFGTLTTISAYRNNEVDSQFDADGTSLRLYSTNKTHSNINTFTQEIRLQSNGSDNRVDWTVGAFIFDEQITAENALLNGPDYRPYFGSLLGGQAQLVALETAARVPVGTIGGAGQGMVDRSEQKNFAWSAFGTADVHITDRLTATLGISHTRDEKDVAITGVSTDSLSAANLDQLGYNATLQALLAQRGVNLQNPASVGPFVQANPALYAQLQQQALTTAIGTSNPFNALRALQLFPPFLNFPNAIEDGHSNDSSTDFVARLAYDVTDNLNVYVSYATGFKASSWNLSRQSRPFAADFTRGNRVVDPVTQQVLRATPASPITNAGLATVNLSAGSRFAEPEDAEVYELGIKGQFDRFAFTFTVFDQTIKNFQTSVFTQSGFVYANAAQQSTKGVEVDFRWSPIDSLILTGAATFLDPVYDSFPNFGPGIDVSGQQPAGIAKTQFTLGANYGFAIGSLDAFVRADWQHIGDSPLSDTPTEAAILEAAGYTREQNLVSMAVGLKTSSKFALTLWARNLFDDRYIVFASPALAQNQTFNGAPNQPRTFGLTLRKSF